MRKKQVLYRNIMDHFMQLTAEERLKPGDKIPTEQELSEQFGVSRITVAKALRELEYIGMVTRTQKRGSFIRQDYDAKPARRSSRTKLPMIGVLLPFEEEIGLDVLRGVEEHCAEHGYYVTYHNTKYDPELERELLLKLVEDDISGAIVYPCSGNNNVEVFGRLIIERFPFVLIDRTVEGLEVPHVISDNKQAGYEMTRCLLELGHRSIAFVCTALREAISVSERYKGYCKALIEAGIAPREEWLIESDVRSFDVREQTPEVQMELARDKLERALQARQRPTAIVSVNDKTAMYIIRSAQERGLSVPSDLSVTGFDNLTAFNVPGIPPLTTIQQDFQRQGRQASVMLIEMCDRPEPFEEVRKIVLATELIVRQSTAVPRKSAAFSR
ncbi:GntR family transcriptional regulator [Cohnella fermenti]|uniref:GntR family transcriptional regulator n=1 Tax=Cohnella fermenti TaxID=2565925 RepID=A0A4S4BF83_9BACL|nr:GntR family transcriptional regulator [Cohnella fermenti]THF72683.1 GntR family transcriptional regulator [Cohnella fermenti]